MPPSRPLPLKQRTSSIDQRRDYTITTWISVIGLLKLREYVITVDHFSIWRRHLAWAVDDGKELRNYLTQRYASSMVFMSLLLSTELNILFNSSGVTTDMRHALMQEHYYTISFWTGIFIIMSAILTLLSLISTFTAWTMVSAVSEVNAHCVFRSSIGQYVAELPGRYIVGAIYTFLVWICLFFFLLLPPGFSSILLLVLVVALFIHTITAFSAFGRVIMHTGAMGSKPIFEKSYESSLLPHSLHFLLLTKAKANLNNKTSIIRQYLSSNKPISRMYSEDEMSGHLSDRTNSDHNMSDHSDNNIDTTTNNTTSIINDHNTDQAPVRKRTESLVKFADGYDTNGERFDMGPLNQDVQFVSTDDNKSNISALSPDIVSPRPPRPQSAQRTKSNDESSSYPTTPIIRNNNRTKANNKNNNNGDENQNNNNNNNNNNNYNQFAEVWLGSSHNSFPEIDNDDDTKQIEKHVGAQMMTIDRDGNETAVAVDNPYLLHTDPIRYVPTVQQQARDIAGFRPGMVITEVDETNSDDNEDERFEQLFGDLFDPEDDDLYYEDPERRRLLDLELGKNNEKKHNNYNSTLDNKK